MYSQPIFLQGIYPFQGSGLTDAHLLSPELAYTVPPGKRAQLVYFRAGNSTSEMVAVVLMRDGLPMRFFPVGGRADSHVPLAVVEDLISGTRIEAFIAAPENVSGQIVLDIGMVII